jgi:hypothetical protein
VEILQFYTLKFYFHNLLYRTEGTTELPGWWPFHTNLLIFSSQTDKPTLFFSASLTELHWTDNSGTRLTIFN